MEKGSSKGTSRFIDISHDYLCDSFERWFKFKCLLHGLALNSVNIQGIHDRGIDLVITIQKNSQFRIGVQIKCYNDIENKKNNLERQINVTLSNYDTFDLDQVVIIFCGDLNNKSQRIKITKQISRIKQKENSDKFIVIDPQGALSIFRQTLPLIDYFNQFEDIPIPIEIFEFEIMGYEKNDSGFPIIIVKSSAFSLNNGKSYVSVAKAYLSIMLGIIAPDIFELGFLREGGKAIFGLCPINKPIYSIVLEEGKEIKIPCLFIRGLEEHGPVHFWGTGFHQSGDDTLKMFLQFIMTKRQFEKDKHYKLIENKWIIIAERLKKIGKIRIDMGNNLYEK